MGPKTALMAATLISIPLIAAPQTSTIAASGSTAPGEAQRATGTAPERSTAVPGGVPIAVHADRVRRSEGCANAIDLYREAVAERPDDGYSHYLLGYCLHTTGDAEAAIDAYTHAARSPAYRANALYNLACILALEGRTDGAIAALTDSIDLAVRDHDRSGFWVAADPDLESIKTDPRFTAQVRRLTGNAFTPGEGARWDRGAAAEGLAEVLDVIEHRHPDAYRYASPADFQAHAQLILERMGRLDEETHALELMRLVARVGDVHSSVWPVLGSDILTNTLPLRLWRFADGLYVRAASPQLADLVGSRIERIGSFDVEAGWQRLVADNPRENDSMATGWLQYLLLLPAFHRLNGWDTATDVATLEVVDRNGVRRTVTVDAPPDPSYGHALEPSLGLTDVPDNWVSALAGTQQLPTWLEATDTNYRFEKLDDSGAYYLAVNLPRHDPERPWEEFLGELFDEMEREGATRLVVDLRHNAGGFHYMAYSLGRHIVRSDALGRAGGVCVLTSRTTQSAGVTFSVVLERETRAVFAGEPGAAAPNFFNGPQGFFSPRAIPGTRLQVKHSVSMIQDSDQRDTRRAIAPDLPTPLTFADFVAGRDPALEACLHLDDGSAAGYLSDDGGRPLPLYFQWRRPSQDAMFPKGPPRHY